MCAAVSAYIAQGMLLCVQRPPGLMLLAIWTVSALVIGVKGVVVQATTQAGCACLASWKDATGADHTGCANPNNDPLVSA
jgi:hypothetical protein